MKIEYPTSHLIQVYLQRFFNNSFISLTSCISVLGNSIGGGNMALLPGANVPGQPITGIDIPIYFQSSNKQSKETIMIIEQDPLRNLNEFLPIFGQQSLLHNAIIGTPNAFHSRPVKFYLNLVKELTKKGYNVYLTDKYKVYAPGLKGNKGRWTTNEKNLLIDEINSINPTFFLLFGKEAQNAYNDIQRTLINLNQCKNNVVNVPHPSGLANKWWKQLGLTKVTDDIKIDYILSIIKHTGLSKPLF